MNRGIISPDLFRGNHQGRHQGGGRLFRRKLKGVWGRERRHTNKTDIKYKCVLNCKKNIYIYSLEGTPKQKWNPPPQIWFLAQSLAISGKQIKVALYDHGWINTWGIQKVHFYKEKGFSSKCFVIWIVMKFSSYMIEAKNLHKSLVPQKKIVGFPQSV